MSKIKSGGGLTSNKLVKPSIQTGSPSKATTPAAAAQIGASTAFKKEQVEFGRAYTGSPLGNQLATNVGAGGPGKGRQVHHCGTQGQWGKPNPGHSRPVRDFLSEFGPDIPGRNYKP